MKYLFACLVVIASCQKSESKSEGESPDKLALVSESLDDYLTMPFSSIDVADRCSHFKEISKRLMATDGESLSSFNCSFFLRNTSIDGCQNSFSLMYWVFGENTAKETMVYAVGDYGDCGLRIEEPWFTSSTNYGLEPMLVEKLSNYLEGEKTEIAFGGSYDKFVDTVIYFANNDLDPYEGEEMNPEDCHFYPKFQPSADSIHSGKLTDIRANEACFDTNGMLGCYDNSCLGELDLKYEFVADRMVFFNDERFFAKPFSEEEVVKLYDLRQRQKR